MSEANFVTKLKRTFPNGKTSTKPGEITDKYVMALCRIYEQRTDAESDYVIEEYGIAERTAIDSLSDCYARASNVAYQNAINRLAGSTEQPAETLDDFWEKSSSAPVQENPVNTEPTSPPDNAVGPLVDEFANDASDTGAVLDFTMLEDAPPTVQKLDLNQNLSVGTPTVSDEIEHARAVQITIIGKAHGCCNWTAGRILDECPEVIAGFAPKYSGEKKTEKDALMALYPEALRKLQKAA